MTDNDTYIDGYYKLKPVDFGLLECLEVRQCVNPETWHGFTLRMVLRPAITAEAKCLTLVFRGVRDLQISSLQGLFCYVVDIRSIRDRQLEGLNYSVSESQHSAFRFLCDNFTASVDNL